MRNLRRIVVGLCASGVWLSPALAEEELQKLIDRLLTRPTIQAEARFTARLLVPPGHVYDPLWFVPRDGVMWVNDDGKEEGAKGSRILSISRDGKITALADIGKLLPVVGFDVAPQSFGAFGGQIFTVAQAKVSLEGLLAHHIIQRVEPQQDYTAHVFCTLPSHGQVNQGISSFGADARFGPEGSPFAGKLFAVATGNNTVYQVTPDGQCLPFVSFDAERFGAPAGLAFSADGQILLVTVARSALLGASQEPAGMIARVRPDGTIEDEPLVRGLVRPMGMDLAPQEFGAYAGQVFVTDAGSFEIPVPMTQALAADGKVYRVTPEGKLQLVASGFVNPMGVRFLGTTLWVNDINGDFIAGKRELPDGFIVELQIQ
ncbi:MAG: SMP-30/gluconolactonase/LRE family protein [Candidatus Binatia bacterium]